MAKLCNKPVQPNPFNSYRDTITGQWRVVKCGSANPGTEMDRDCYKGLRRNLCQTYREPQTGHWLVRLPARPVVA